MKEYQNIGMIKLRKNLGNENKSDNDSIHLKKPKSYHFLQQKKLYLAWLKNFLLDLKVIFI